MEKCNLISKAWASNLKNFEINSVPLSDVMWLGTLCLEKIFWTKRLARPAALIKLCVGTKITCFVSLSTTTSIFVWPSDSSRHLMKSIDIDSHRHGITLQANFPWKITFDKLYNNGFLIGICSRTLFISSECNIIWWVHWAGDNWPRAHVKTLRSN